MVKLLSSAAIAAMVVAVGSSAMAQNAQVIQSESYFYRARTTAVADRTPPEFEPVGAKWGGFTAITGVDLGTEFNDNVYYVQPDPTATPPIVKKSDESFVVRPNIDIKSNWSRHALEFGASAGFTDYSKYTSENHPDWTVAGAGRYDLVGLSYLFANASVVRNVDSRGDSVALITINNNGVQTTIPTSEIAKPIRYTESVATVGITSEINRLRFTASEVASKYDYDDAYGFDGTDYSMLYRNRTEYLGRLRGDYAVSPDTSVYISAQSRNVDYVINTKNSHGYSATIGTSFDITNLVRGEIELGHLESKYVNGDKASGPSYKALVNWFPTEMTTLTFNAGEVLNESAAANADGYFNKTIGFSVDHELLRNIILSAGYGHVNNAYTGINRTDNRDNFSAGVKYKIGHGAAILASYAYVNNKSVGADAGNSYVDNSVKLGLSLAY